MLANWIHIVIVHLAVIGTPWLLYRTWVHRKKPLAGNHWKGNYTGVLVLGIVASIAYYTGPQAADYTKQILDSYSQDLVEDHALWGRVAFVIQVVAALLGIMGWASILQEEKPYGKLPLLLGVLMLLNTVVIFYTAHLGGLIRRLDLM
jgi:uncharacterized membrane protein